MSNQQFDLYWGDSHTNIHPHHINDISRTMDHAGKVLDFFPIAYYPFTYYKQNGLRIESCNHRKQFDKDWDIITEVIHENNNPGKFITFPGYEWHGNRRYYGDHNVFYLNDFESLVDFASIEELYQYLREHTGIAIPHHTAYSVHQRGKDWDYFDPEISPLVEIFSNHGSSEGCNTPFTLDNNKSMGGHVSLMEAFRQDLSGDIKQDL